MTPVAAHAPAARAALAHVSVGGYFTRSDAGEHLGKDQHIYQQSYQPVWVRYEHRARARMVSKYQFRSPGEWLAYVVDKLPVSR